MKNIKYNYHAKRHAARLDSEVRVQETERPQSPQLAGGHRAGRLAALPTPLPKLDIHGPHPPHPVQHV